MARIRCVGLAEELTALDEVVRFVARSRNDAPIPGCNIKVAAHQGAALAPCSSDCQGAHGTAGDQSKRGGVARGGCVGLRSVQGVEDIYSGSLSTQGHHPLCIAID